MSNPTPPAIGTRFLTPAGVPAKVVGYRQKLKGEILDTPPDRGVMFTVFVEQAGRYRLGTTRTANVLKRLEEQ